MNSEKFTTNVMSTFTGLFNVSLVYDYRLKNVVKSKQ